MLFGEAQRNRVLTVCFGLVRLVARNIVRRTHQLARRVPRAYGRRRSNRLNPSPGNVTTRTRLAMPFVQNASDLIGMPLATAVGVIIGNDDDISAAQQSRYNSLRQGFSAPLWRQL